MVKKGIVMMFIVLFTMSFTTSIRNEFLTNVKVSKVEWKGFKPGGEHFGSIAIKEGSLTIEGNRLVTGTFIIDMKSIVDLDMPTDNAYNAKLVKHLKSSDFFDVEKFPTAKFQISGSQFVKGKTLVKGYLTIKGIRKEISFLAKISTNEIGQHVLESETFKVNRADYNVKFKSKTFYANLKDKFIYDEFEIKIKVVSTKK